MKPTLVKPVEANLLYLASRDTPATYMASEAGGDIPEHKGEYVRQPVSIQNARPINDKLSLDREGFRLFNQSTEVTDFYDDNQIATTYESEVKRSVNEALTALGESVTHIDIFDHTRRTSSEAMRKALKVREPASIIHNDYTDKSGLNIRDDFFEKDQAMQETLKDRRFVIINVWRSIGGTVQQSPMTLCSADSIDTDDVIDVERYTKNYRGEVQLAVWNPKQQWYYFPEMTMQEALIFKTFDSSKDGRARYTIHTAFDDPNSAADSPARESIETRCLVFL